MIVKKKKEGSKKRYQAVCGKQQVQKRAFKTRKKQGGTGFYRFCLSMVAYTSGVRTIRTVRLKWKCRYIRYVWIKFGVQKNKKKNSKLFPRYRKNVLNECFHYIRKASTAPIPFSFQFWVKCVKGFAAVSTKQNRSSNVGYLPFGKLEIILVESSVSRDRSIIDNNILSLIFIGRNL